MKTTISLLAAALFLTATSAFAQFASSPLEPGLFEFMKRNMSGVHVVDDRHMKAGPSEVTWVSPQQITISATVASVSDRQAAAKMIAEFNTYSSVGTMRIEGAVIVMIHHVNPRLARQPEIAALVSEFNTELRRQAARFNAPIAKN